MKTMLLMMANRALMLPVDLRALGPLATALLIVVCGHAATPDDAPARSVQDPATSRFLSAAELPLRPKFPDPLVMLDGRQVTTREQWVNERRPELIALFQRYMYGYLPPPPEQVQGEFEREDRRALGGKATLKEVTVKFGPARRQTGGPPQLPPTHLMLVVPKKRSGPAPVILSMNYFGNHTLVDDPAVSLSTNWMPERGQGVVNNRATEASRGTWVKVWGIEQIVERGYAVATFYNGDIDPDRPDERGLQVHFRETDQRPGPHECGTIAAWAWGLSRAVDYLVTDADVDKRRIVVTGHSRLGKAALLAAALDERIALAIPHQAGTGGSGLSRVSLKDSETVKQINDKFPHWFCATFKEFNDQPGRLPFDQYCLVALCAPRPVLFTNGRNDTWINPPGQFDVLCATAPVYRLLNAGDFAATQLPPDGKLIDSTLGYFIRPGGHSLRPEDWTAFLDFADKHLGLPEKPRAAAADPPEEAERLVAEVPRNERLDAAFKLIREAVENAQVPGAIALVAHNGRIVRQEAFGFSDPDRQVPFRTNTLCWIASVTKPVTVAAAMTLVDEGKLSLEDGCFRHGGSSGTEVFADPKTGVAGILFCQFSDRPGRVWRLHREFRRQVWAAFEQRGSDLGARQR